MKKKIPLKKVPKIHAADKRPEPEQARPASTPRRPRGRFGALTLALVGALTAALGFVTAAIKADHHEPKQAPCPCVCGKS
jgi:ferric-dicitrate binding protein FerR (iron transport regulator)